MLVLGCKNKCLANESNTNKIVFLITGASCACNVTVLFKVVGFKPEKKDLVNKNNESECAITNKIIAQTAHNAERINSSHLEEAKKAS